MDRAAPDAIIGKRPIPGPGFEVECPVGFVALFIERAQEAHKLIPLQEQAARVGVQQLAELFNRAIVDEISLLVTPGLFEFFRQGGNVRLGGDELTAAPFLCCFLGIALGDVELGLNYGFPRFGLTGCLLVFFARHMDQSLDGLQSLDHGWTFENAGPANNDAPEV